MAACSASSGGTALGKWQGQSPQGLGQGWGNAGRQELGFTKLEPRGSREAISFGEGPARAQV